MSIEQFIKIGPVAMGKPCSMGNIALSGLQNLNQILLLKLPSGLGQGHYFLLIGLNGIIEQLFSNKS